MMSFDTLFKYFLEGFAIALAVYVVTGKSFSIQRLAVIALSAAIVFMLLDQFSPATGYGARLGSGFGIGFQALNIPATGLGALSLMEPFGQQRGGGNDEFAETQARVDAASAASTESDIVKVDVNQYPVKDCSCGTTCAGTCGPEKGCPINCATAPCSFGRYQDISSPNCAYKLVDSDYARKALLPGYNECVQPHEPSCITAPAAGLYR